MLTELAAATRHHHAAADADRLQILEKPTLERYRAFLAQIYRFEAPIEAALIATEETGRLHLKTRRLAADLEAVGLAPGEVGPPRRLRFSGRAEALGWMWVLHRNTLLHGLIYRVLQTKLPETMLVAGSYLSVFEGRAGALMRELGAEIDLAAREPATASRILHAASEAFRHQRQWYACDQLAPRPARLTVRERSRASKLRRAV